MKIKRMRFMTRREYVAKHFPDCICSDIPGGVRDCPHAFSGEICRKDWDCYEC